MAGVRDRNVVMVGYLQYVPNGTGDNVALLGDGRQLLEAVDHRPSQTGFELAGVVSQPLRKRKGSSELKFGRQAVRTSETCLLAVIPPRTYDRPSLQSCENAGGVDLGTAREIVLCSAD